MLLNPQVKQNIVCLQLSNENTSGQIELFFSLFSSDEFTYLRSLKLIGLYDHNVEQILSELPFLSNLDSFSFTCQECGTIKIMHAISKLNIRTLTISKFTILSRMTREKMLFIISLNINNCVIDDLLKLFQCKLVLKYLEIQYFHHSDILDEMISTNIISLNHFIIKHSKIKSFAVVRFLLTQMSNLKSFAISSSEAEMINAFRWENLIKNSLHHLHTFKFCFNYIDNDDLKIKDKLPKCQAFETIFWDQHNWFINYEVDEFTLLIFTTPYIRKEYKLFPLTNKFIYNFNDENLFNNVTHLTVYKNARKTEFHYFPNVLSLTLKSSYHHLSSNHNLSSNYNLIGTLNEIMNTSSVKHLTFHESNSSLEEIIKQLLNVNSLTIGKSILLSLLDNCKTYELWENCFYKKIINLNISDGCLFTVNDTESNLLNSIHMIFSNIQRLQCNLIDLDVLLFILQSCSKLSMINLGYISREMYSWIQLNASSLDIYFDFKSIK